MHSYQFCHRTFAGKFNGDLLEVVSCPKRFDDGEAMTSFSNDKEDLERRPEKHHEEDDDKLNKLPKDLDAVGDDVDEEGKDDGEEETDLGDIQ